jgi:hypothetical protein
VYNGQALGVTERHATGAVSSVQFRDQFSYVLHPFAARYSHWMWHLALLTLTSVEITTEGLTVSYPKS